MSKQRYVQDSFWTDPYVEKLSPDYKLVFLYLLTNPQCNIAGVYEARAKRIAYETGYDIEVIENILRKFSDDKKIIQYKDWIIIINHIKYQSLGNSTAEGINRIIKTLPIEIRKLFTETTLVNTKNEAYSVLVLTEKTTDLIDPLETPPFRAYSEVKLSKVIYNKYSEFENVNLTDEEHQKLIAKIGLENTNLLIEELGGYIASTKKKYANHYATLQNWARRKINTHIEKLQTKQRYIA